MLLPLVTLRHYTYRRSPYFSFNSAVITSFSLCPTQPPKSSSPNQPIRLQRKFSQGTNEFEPIGMTADKLNLVHSPLCWDEFLGWIVHFQNTVIASDRCFYSETLYLDISNNEGNLRLYQNVPSLLIDKKVPLAGDTLPCQMLEISLHLAHFVRIENIYQGPDVLIEDWNLPMDMYYSGHHTMIQGLSYWDEPLALVYEGAGLAFPVASYHETPQIPTHF
ncbi:hypothetical protein OG21DRAFT_1489267 [Imleria badia]|nr:hypothetical protein OG21DRAFT_1489267 [Imleria badia]